MSDSPAQTTFTPPRTRKVSSTSSSQEVCYICLLGFLFVCFCFFVTCFSLGVLWVCSELYCCGVVVIWRNRYRPIRVRRSEKFSYLYIIDHYPQDEIFSPQTSSNQGRAASLSRATFPPRISQLSRCTMFIFTWIIMARMMIAKKLMAGNDIENYGNFFNWRHKARYKKFNASDLLW